MEGFSHPALVHMIFSSKSQNYVHKYMVTKGIGRQKNEELTVKTKTFPKR